MATYIVSQEALDRYPDMPGVTRPGIYTYNGQTDRYELVTTDIAGWMGNARQRTLGRALALAAMLTTIDKRSPSE